jgi:hypothetical protein
MSAKLGRDRNITVKRTQAKVLDHNRREQPEYPSVRQTQHHATFPQVPHIIDVDTYQLR